MQNHMNGILDTMKMMMLMNMKDNNMFNTICYILLSSLISFIMSNDNCYFECEKIIKNILSYFSIFQPKYNSVILDGKRCLKVTNYLTKTDNLFSNRFSAFWYYISKNNMNNDSIYCIREYANSSNIYDDYGEPKRYNKNYELDNDIDLDDVDTNKDLFIVDQTKYFKLTENIYCKVSKVNDTGDEKKSYEMEHITIEIYSYKLGLNDIVKYIDNIDNDYKNSLKKARNNKKYIYTLIAANDNTNSNSYEREVLSKWEECEFISTRTFKNLFFENKKFLINKLNFFTENKDWYNYEGHPYTFGIGLHGPPGTGKTSVIKCIANKLQRHIIVIPLSKIKTQTEFSEYFFENYYNRKNRKKIDFADKIIVFEDIDCMSDIVKARPINSENNSESEFIEHNEHNESNMDKTMKLQNKLLNKIAKKVDEDHNDMTIIDFDKSKNDKITLSFILNTIDGLRETPGRILIITSNNYNSLDPALVRPGRIDITLEMKNATIDTIKEMYHHYYKDFIDIEIENQLVDYKISPAKLVNLRLENENKEDFLQALIKEMK